MPKYLIHAAYLAIFVYIGGIINRFSRDMGIADEELHWVLGDMFEVGYPALTLSARGPSLYRRQNLTSV